MGRIRGMELKESIGKMRRKKKSIVYNINKNMCTCMYNI